MARSRTTKTIAKRIDLGYFKRPHALRSWKRGLTWLAGIIALIWVSAASMRFTNGRLARSDQIYNPAPVTQAHAMFQNDCVQCHTPKSGGGFVLSVTDEACLKCHDGSLHHPNQKQTSELSLVSRTTGVLAMTDANHPGGARSADCATCHVEHKGLAMLSATSDAHCIVCHADLKSATIDSNPKAANHVVAFDLADHPGFGRKLRDASGTWVDPTILKFNHKAHQENAAAFKNVANNCVICHKPDPSDRRYMLPISYEQDCQRCHELRPLPDGVPVVHGDMSLVRAQLGNPGVLIETALAAMPREKREPLLVKRTMVRGRPTTAPVSQEDWIKDKLDALNKDALDWLEGEGSKIQGFPELHAAATQPSDQNRGTVRLLEAYTAFGITQSCARCHKVEETPALQAYVTAPTGIGRQPRRWFTASIFDHQAHREETCRDCHESAWTSEKTSDLLLPDINTSAAGAQTCVQCHHADASPGQRGAPASCYVCHDFHDRSLERPLLTMKK